MKPLLTSAFGLLMILSMSAQVGVNNNNPEQALDVNGKIKLTDDSTTPSAGTMRYNDTGKSFEGYDGAQWNSFNNKKSSALPSNPMPIYGWSEGIKINEQGALTFSPWGGSPFQTPPAGKLLIITGIYPRLNGSARGRTYEFDIGVAQSIDAYHGSRNFLVVYSDTNSIQAITGDASPLFVIQPGQYLTVRNYASSTFAINMHVRGFLVDDLNY